MLKVSKATKTASDLNDLFAKNSQPSANGLGVKPKASIWEGPCGKGPQGGVTQSLLSHFLTCRERFRLYVVEGISAEDEFSPPMEFGNMWHLCEVTMAKHKDWADKNVLKVIHKPLLEYCGELCKRYPTQQPQIDNWYNVCRVEFPHYVAYWGRNDMAKDRTPLLQEQTFDVLYCLPSGRAVRLRGKWDGVNIIGKGSKAGIYLFETKTKGRIEEEQLKRQVTFDLQTMLYLVALEVFYAYEKVPPIRGIHYNVVKRPAQYQGKKETKQEFLDRLSGIIADSPGEFFMRWQIEVSVNDVLKFRRQCFDPILEQLCDWWDWVSRYINLDPWSRELKEPDSRLHYRHPYGVRNVLDDGGSTDLDYYMDTGNDVGLARVESLFGELEE